MRRTFPLATEFIAQPPIGVNTVPLFYGTVGTPAEILETFEHRVRELNEPGGPVEALKHLRRHAEGSLARVIIDAAQEVAAADRRIDPREQHILQLIWITLGGPLPRPAARPSRGGGHREPTNRV